MAKKVASAAMGSCSRAPRWVSYAAITVIAVVLFTLIYQWFVARKMQEMFQEQSPFRMIYVHMEGCGYCERFTPVWMDFTQQYSSELRVKGVSVEHYDRTAPEWQELGINDINGFPAVILINRSDNSRVATFSGERTVPVLYQWVLSSAGL